MAPASTLVAAATARASECAHVRRGSEAVAELVRALSAEEHDHERIVAALAPFCSAHVDGALDVASSADAHALRTSILPGLVQLLAPGSSVDAHVAAARALGCLAWSAATLLAEPIVDVGAIPPLVQLLRAEDKDECREAAHALARFAHADALRPLIAEAGALPSLVALLQRGDEDLQRKAADVVGWLAREDTLCTPIAEAGAIPPLVALLWSEECGVLFDAADALEWLAQTDSLRAPIADAGAIPPLVRLLNSDHGVMQRMAADALDSLANVSDETRQMIAAAGAIPRLVALLSSDDEFVRCAAVEALSSLASSERMGIVAHGAIQPLSRLLQVPDVRVRERALMAIFKLSQCIVRDPSELVQAGVLEQLVPFLRPRTSTCAGRRAMYHATSTLFNMVAYCTAHLGALAATPGLVIALLNAMHTCSALHADCNCAEDDVCVEKAAFILAELLGSSVGDVRTRALATLAESCSGLTARAAEASGLRARLCSLADAVGAPSRQQHDVVLQCADGTELGASRLLLTQHSRYYERQLGGGLSEGTKREVAADPDFSSAAHEALLRQLHSAGVAPLPTDPSMALEMLRLANKLQPPPDVVFDEAAKMDVLAGIVRRCEDALLAGLDVENCLDVLQHAKAAGGSARLVQGVRRLAKVHIGVIVKQKKWAAFKRTEPEEAFELMEALAVEMAAQLTANYKRQRVDHADELLQQQS